MEQDRRPCHATEQALQDSETRLQQVLDNTSALVFAKDSQGRYIFVNREFERMASRSSADILGRIDDEIFPPDIAVRFRHNDLQVLQQQRAIEFEETADFGDGARTYIATKFPLFDAAGLAYAVCGMATDISDRKRLEESLSAAALAVSVSEEETLYRQLVRFLATILRVDAAFVATLDSQDPPRLNMLAFFLDGATRENFSYPQAGTPCETVVGQQFRLYASGLTKLFPGDRDFSSLGLESYAGYPLFDRQGRALGLIAVVSRRPLEQAAVIESVLRIFAVRVNAELERVASREQREKLEGRLRQAQRMEAIGQLTGGIAHDFNNLLTTIMGYVVLAGERDASREDRKLAGYLDQARRSCERARDLIQQMLTFSRGQRGSPRPMKLARLVEDSLPALQASLSPAIDVRVRASNSDTTVRVDPVQVEQVLLNLCINARDAMEGKGTLVVDVQQTRAEGAVCAGCRQPFAGSFIELSVADSGPGIERAVAERIFEPFYSTKEVGKGTGMGLAIVHGIVHDQGGHVVLETRPGAGACFRVLWPVGQGKAAETDAGQAVAATAGLRRRPSLHGSVLIVDDEESVGEYMRELLETWNVRATCVTRGDAALDLITAAPDRFDVVITDHAMPRMTGLELLRRLHGVRPGLPVILCTGYGEGLAVDAQGAARPRAILRKPIEPAQLVTALEDCLPPLRAERQSA